MIRIYVMVEGQTEETFVREVLYDHFLRLNIHIDAILIETKRGFKGGLVSYSKVKTQIIRQCREKHSAWVTTLFDLYGLPNNFPSKDSTAYNRLSCGHDKASFLEEKLFKDINEQNFIPNILVHEYEALLFSDITPFSDWTDENIVQSLRDIASQYISPEHINDGPQTAPSKRIIKLMPGYDKVLQGCLIANDIGLDQIRQNCTHFNNWLDTLENLNKE